jgi:uncharacterized repeat protein (TIGR01451 family)
LSHLGNFTKTSGSSPGVGTFVIIVGNNGGTATGGTITVTDTLPAGLTATSINGSRAWNCTLSPLSCNRKDPLGPGLTYFPITVTVSVSGGLSVPVTLTNSASVSGGSTTGASATDHIAITQ